MLKYLILLIYILLMIGIGIHSSRRIRTSGDYLVAGNRGNIWQITGSLLATILGSSAFWVAAIWLFHKDGPLPGCFYPLLSDSCCWCLLRLWSNDRENTHSLN